MATFDIVLRNDSPSPLVFAYVTGTALDSNNALFLLQSDGKTAFFPESPGAVGTKVAADCAIRLEGSGASKTVTIPHLAGARIWFSIEQPLIFLLNPGPALVEPSTTNPTDPNIDIVWGFAEFTWNDAQMFANVSSVDFVCLPISLDLESTTGNVQSVGGFNPRGLENVCKSLREQSNREGNPRWASLIYTANGRDTFDGYFEPYVDQVWEHYRNHDLTIDTQGEWGIVSGRVVGDQLRIAGESFDKPSSADIFGCSSGPFQEPLRGVRAALAPRIAAGFNRSTLLNNDGKEPSAKGPQTHYALNITNHYSRIIHENEVDGRGYAFPYDDVNPSGGVDQSGCVSDGSPKLLTVTLRGR